jgi:hypothetical protein
LSSRSTPSRNSNNVSSTRNNIPYMNRSSSLFKIDRRVNENYDKRKVETLFSSSLTSLLTSLSSSGPSSCSFVSNHYQKSTNRCIQHMPLIPPQIINTGTNNGIGIGTYTGTNTGTTRSFVTSTTKLSASKKAEIFHHGDKVQLNGTNMEGIITERKGGWYTVQIIENDNGTGTGTGIEKEVKKRGTQMKKISSFFSSQMEMEVAIDTTMEGNSNGNSNSNIKSINTMTKEENFQEVIIPPEALLTEQIQNLPDVPTMIDLDKAIINQYNNQNTEMDTNDKIQNIKDIQYINQCIEFTKYKKWIMFTDLHCSPSTLPTCINVLHQVHRVAKEQNAGVLFLGDFWHHRGSVRVDCLNAVLDALSDWDVPMIMVSSSSFIIFYVHVYMHILTHT